MLKKNKLSLILSSLVILLPAIVSLILWDKLPENMAIHFGFDGQPDSFASKAVMLFTLPLILLIFQWVCAFFTARDKGNKNQNKKIMGIVLWIVPFISLMVHTTIYAVAFSVDFSPVMAVSLLIAIMFIAMGNYLPKCRQNSTIGIKLPWTLANEENWNKTHRLGGKIWVVCGVLMLIIAFLPERISSVLFVPVILIAAVMPMVYSFTLSRKRMKTGDYVKPPRKPLNTVIGVIVLVLILALCIPMFFGDIEFTVNKNSINAESFMWADLAFSTSDIENVEYRDRCDPGVRTNGFGSPGLLMGTFQSDEFGFYTRYSYTKCDAAVILTVKDETVILGCETPEQTKALYDEISSIINLSEN